MNKREAREQGLKEIHPYNFSGFSNNREELKLKIKELRKKYNVRIVLVSTGSGYNRYVENRAFAEPILCDYLFLEKAEEKAAKLEEERKRIDEEYRIKLEDLELKHLKFNREYLIAKENIEKRMEEKSGKK